MHMTTYFELEGPVIVSYSLLAFASLGNGELHKVRDRASSDRNDERQKGFKA